MGHSVGIEVHGLSCDGEPAKATQVSYYRPLILSAVYVVRRPLSGCWKCPTSWSGRGSEAVYVCGDAHSSTVRYTVLRVCCALMKMH